MNTRDSRDNKNKKWPEGRLGRGRKWSFRKETSCSSPPTIEYFRMNGDSSYSRSGSTPASGTTTYAKPAPISVEQSRVVARTHFDALKSWLARLDATNSSSRNNAREKLTRLTRQQFLELSTDVYDELVRRVDDAAGRPDNGYSIFSAISSLN